MRSTAAILACSLVGAGLSVAKEFVEAPVVKGNPEGVVYRATLLDKDNTEVRGTVEATAGPGGEGVTFSVDVSGFPDEKEFGPFSYHIHDQPVPEDGNCTKTLAHLDPFQRGEDPVCDKDKPATCQVGDLSGKFGSISDVADGKHFTQTYHDLYTSTRHGPGAFFGNRSVVFHYKDKFRVNCGNFVLVKGEPPAGNHSVLPTGAYPTPSATSSPTASPPPFEGTANRVGALSVGVMLAGVAALVW
ncbi:hypothetical protein AJ79_06884 [Helicocarpus griseus UAMH5409]|uniref:superoxide dismutase n=1 Tax=Helicocarpus griseus UAMH5409 TaxID=1447875 RepID=A0A2B7X7U5_9EURO|nr:hypothetical protein AJ79_06884 [Helicocarpus griseus UAMH5409]